MDVSGKSRDIYGGLDNAESSGIMRHVSIRHGGSEMPNPPVNFQNVINGDETNGLSLNGVGSGTSSNTSRWCPLWMMDSKSWEALPT